MTSLDGPRKWRQGLGEQVLGFATVSRPANRAQAAGSRPGQRTVAGGAGLAAVVVVYLAAFRLTDDRQRLRIDRLTAKG